MQKLLIAARSDDLCAAMKTMFSRDLEVTVCHDGSTALVLLRAIRPDALILDLFLPEIDGLALLQQLDGNVPPVILALTDCYPSSYEYQSGIDLGIRHFMTKPFRTEAAYMHIMKQFQYAAVSKTADPLAVADAHLEYLEIDRSCHGFQQLRLGIPMVAQDPTIRLEKELYVCISRLTGGATPRQIERTIRYAILDAWKRRDPAVWDRYFPGCTKPPSIKRFLARLAKELQQSRL